jgi:hypothetical protein
LKEEVVKFEILPPERLPNAQACSSVSCEQNGYYTAQQFFCVRELIETESAIAMHRDMVQY